MAIGPNDIKQSFLMEDVEKVELAIDEYLESKASSGYNGVYYLSDAITVLFGELSLNEKCYLERLYLAAGWKSLGVQYSCRNESSLILTAEVE